MTTWQLVLIIFCGMSLVQSLFLGTLLLMNDRLARGAQFYLGVMLVGLAFRLTKSYFVFLPHAYPEWGIVAGGAGLWLVGPAFYFYAKHTFQAELKVRHIQLFHFLPAAIIALTGITRYVYYIGLLHFLIYFVYSLYLAKTSQVASVPRHFRIFAICTGLILLCMVIQASQGGIRIYTFGLGIATCILYVINFFLTRDTTFLKAGIRKSRAIDQALAAKINADLSQLLSEQKIYRNKGLTVSALAKKVNYPVYLVSQSINQQYQIRFNEYLNRFRVQEVMERLSSREHNDKIETIAREVGFSSMTSLYEAFKKETQVTPQVFRKQFHQR